MSEAGAIGLRMSMPGRTEAAEASRTFVSFPGPDAELRALTAQAAAGEERAAREFFESYCDRIFRYALVLTRGQEDLAREILSAVMIKGLRQLKPMDSDGDVWRWLTHIARNSFVDHCRHSKRRIDASAELSVTMTAQSVDSTLNVALNECLDELPADEREIVEGYYFEDQSQNELAESANTTRKAVESRLARIRLKLRAAILKKIS